MKNLLLVIFPFIMFNFFWNNKILAQEPKFLVDTITRVVDATLPPYNQIQPGDTLYFRAGMRDYLLLRNFTGTPEKPVILMNFKGVVSIQTDHYFGILFENSRYFRFTGTGDTGYFYGFMVCHVTNGAGLSLGKLSSDYEVDHISIEDVPIGGIYAKTDPDCSLTATRDKFTQFNTVFHDNYISGSGNEGMYIGSTKYSGQTVNCNGKDTLLLPSLLNGVRIYNNIIRYSGWDGIQVSSAYNNCQVYDNIVIYDSQAEYFSQMSGILLGGGSKCDCYNNYISEGKGDGIESHGLGGTRIFNNIILNAGRTFQPTDPKQMKHGIFISDVSTLPDSSYFILFNDIINPKSDGIRFSSTRSKNNLLSSNVIINPGNFDYYENGGTSYKGKDSYIMLTDTAIKALITNNFFRRNADSAGFSSGYTLLPISPLIDAGYFNNKGIFFDFYHRMRPYGNGFDIGAHEFNPAYLGISGHRDRSNDDIVLYPNPVRDSFSIRYNIAKRSVVILDIFNLQGNKIETHDLGLLENGIHADSFNVMLLRNGVYLYILHIGNQYHSGKFIKVGRR